MSLKSTVSSESQTSQWAECKHSYFALWLSSELHHKDGCQWDDPENAIYNLQIVYAAYTFNCDWNALQNHKIEWTDFCCFLLNSIVLVMEYRGNSIYSILNISKIATAHSLCLKISHDFCSNHSWKGLRKRTQKMIHADSVCFNFKRLFVPLKRVKIDVSANWPMKTSSHCPCVTAGEAGWTFLMQVSGAVCPSL